MDSSPLKLNKNMSFASQYDFSGLENRIEKDLLNESFASNKSFEEQNFASVKVQDVAESFVDDQAAKVTMDQQNDLFEKP